MSHNPEASYLSRSKREDGKRHHSCHVRRAVPMERAAIAIAASPCSGNPKIMHGKSLGYRHR